MRVLAGLFRRIRHAGLGEQLHRPSARLSAIGVGPQRFPDLEANLPDGIEVRHRVLGYVADATTSDRPEQPAVSLAIGRSDDDPVKSDAASCDSPTGWQQPKDRGGRGGFPRPRFAHHGDGLPAHDAQIHSTHRGGVVAEPDFQALDRQQRRFRGVRHARHAREAGSRASRKASPIIMNASTVIASAPAG